MKKFVARKVKNLKTVEAILNNHCPEQWQVVYTNENYPYCLIMYVED